MTDISIIIPTFNSEKTIQETLDSILIQSSKYSFEVLITDDYSTDRTVSIIKEYQKKAKNIFLFELKQNKGPAFSRNKSIKNAKGRYLMFCDSDDIWIKNKIEKQMEFMKSNSSPMSCGFYANFNNSLKDASYESFRFSFSYNDLLSYNYIGTSTVCIDRKYFKNIEFPALKRRQDYALWLKLAKDIDHIYCMQEILTFRRILKNSVSNKKFKLFNYNFYVLNKLEGKSKVFSFFLIALYVLKKLYNRFFNTKKAFK
tara:strand:+ start:5314 stop:6084 length:771 start_codon:yes stop_codon:yes gene_type:complete